MSSKNLDTADAFMSWLRTWDAEGLSLGTSENLDGPRQIEGVSGNKRETVLVPRHVFDAVHNDLLWMHQEGGGALPKDVIFGLRGKYATRKGASDTTGEGVIAAPLPARPVTR